MQICAVQHICTAHIFSIYFTWLLDFPLLCLLGCMKCSNVLQLSGKKRQSAAGFSDQNKSWLKPKQQEAASDSEIDDLVEANSEGTFTQIACDECFATHFGLLNSNDNTSKHSACQNCSAEASSDH